MPKKANRHAPPRTKSRPRRAPPRPSAPPPSSAAAEEEVASSGVVATAPTAARTTAAAPAATSAVPRRPVRPSAARAPALTINYAYLRHDLRTLALLAPLMVILVVASFFVFH